MICLRMCIFLQTGWIVKALNSSATFDNVDLTEKDWADFDERADESVAIYELQHKIIGVR